MFKILKKVFIRLFLSIVFSILLVISLYIGNFYIYPWFYKTFMPLKALPIMYSSNEKFKAEEYFIPYLHYSLNINTYHLIGGYSMYRVTNIQTGEVLGEMKDETLEAPFQFVGDKFCIDSRFAGNRTEDECCIDLK